MRNRIVGFLLHHANSNPPLVARREFYDMKTRLLERYGTKLGVDVQHIIKHCYNCDTGCHKCNWYGKGGGVWDEFWSFLDLYQLGSHRFHVPRKKVYQQPSEAVTVEGFITHKYPKFYLYSEAFYWLAFMFDRKLFRETFGYSGHVCKKFTPMVWAATLYFYWRCPDSFLRGWRHRYSKLKKKLTPKGLTILKIEPPDDIPF